jgi:polysaccharide deacetylase family protein (PEP-CTERM system associated)
MMPAGDQQCDAVCIVGLRSLAIVRGHERQYEMTGVLNTFTVDVDDRSEVPEAFERDTERTLDVLAGRGACATFFVTSRVAERSAPLVRRIAAAGHEIASHGGSHDLLHLQTPSAFRAETRRAKHHLEQLTRAPVVGYRAASFSMKPESLWALDVLIDLGFEYDASEIFGTETAPARVTAPSGRVLAQFPRSATGHFGVPLPVGPDPYFGLLPYWLSRAGLHRINTRQRRPFSFSLHPADIGRMEPRLVKLLGEFRFATVREVLESHGLMRLRERVPTVPEAPPPDAPYVGPERRRRSAGE